MNILVTLDQNYFPQLQVMLTSLKLNNPGEQFSLYLLHNHLPEQMLEAVNKWCGQAGYGFFPVQMDEELFRSAPASSRYPVEMYYRLLAAWMLPEDLDRMIYLDPDTLIINPLRPLWETNMTGWLFGAAAHTGKTEFANDMNRLRLGVEHDYYNSGVLLMDLKLERQEILPEKIFQYVEEHRMELILPDQDLLNALYGERIFPLDDALWNYDARNYNNYLMRSSGKCNVKWVMENTGILHFCGKAKPWKPGYIYRFGMLYQHYMQLAMRDWGQEG